MSAVTTRRTRILPGIVLGALIAFAPARASPPELVMRTHSASLHLGAQPRLMPEYIRVKSFYESYLALPMSHGLRDELGPAAEAFTVPTSNFWAKDPITVQRVEGRSIRAVERSLKGYVIERLGIERWSLPLFGRKGRNAAAPSRETGATKLRFGFSHMAPRADLLIPATGGRVIVSADARGRVGTTFEPTTSRLRFAADVDVPERTATARMSVRF
jgi:hypothetical protein